MDFKIKQSETKDKRVLFNVRQFLKDISRIREDLAEIMAKKSWWEFEFEDTLFRYLEIVNEFKERAKSLKDPLSTESEV